MKPLCAYPWCQFYMMGMGQYGPCCNIGFGNGSVYPSSKDEVVRL